MPEYIKYVSESPAKVFFSSMTKIGGGAYGNVFVARPKSMLLLLVVGCWSLLRNDMMMMIMIMLILPLQVLSQKKLGYKNKNFPTEWP